MLTAILGNQVAGQDAPAAGASAQSADSLTSWVNQNGVKVAAGVGVFVLVMAFARGGR
jgi:hypothetical protein